MGTRRPRRASRAASGHGGKRRRGQCPLGTRVADGGPGRGAPPGRAWRGSGAGRPAGDTGTDPAANLRRDGRAVLRE